MLYDAQTSFTAGPSGAAASLVGAAGTYLAPNTYDTGPLGAYLTELTTQDTQLGPNVNAGRDIGANARLQLIVEILTGAVGGTSVDFQLITSATPDLASPTVIQDLGVILTANLGRGTVLRHYVKSSALYQRYVGLQAVQVGTYTAGAYFAGFVLDSNGPIAGYASGFSVK